MMFSRWVCQALVVWLAFMAALARSDENADLVLRGGPIATVDAAKPIAEAIAVGGDRILAVGTREQIDAHIGPKTKVIELNGRMAIPGFIEGHGHFLSLGDSKRMLDLTSAKNWNEIVSMVGDAAERTPAGKWILGRGWHQSKWNPPPQPHVEGYPLHAELSRVSPNNPVLLTHASGHSCIANAYAMRMAGVDKNAKEPSGGKVLKQKNGLPTGVFRETAMGLIHRAHRQSQRRRTAEQIKLDRLESVELAVRECWRHGVTSFQDAGSSFAEIDLFRQLADEGKLGVRLWVMINEGNNALSRRLADYRMVGVGNHHLTVRGIKRMFDGALGTHGAWLFEPYEDLPGNRGLNTLPIKSLERTAELAIEHDVQLCVHAIGDRANHEVLNAFAKAFAAHPKKRDLRWRIEHAQHLAKEDIPRFKTLGVIASMQAVHATSDAPFVVQRLGLRRAQQGAYVWRSLLDAGAIVTNGTDAPVERIDPLASFYSSVTRKLPGGATFFPEQCMTRAEALKSYTYDAAFAAFQEKQKGVLSVAKLADIVVLSTNILKAEIDDLQTAQVDMTIIGGRVVYQRHRSP